VSTVRVEKGEGLSIADIKKRFKKTQYSAINTQ
jgi:hypothetical protein